MKPDQERRSNSKQFCEGRGQEEEKEHSIDMIAQRRKLMEKGKRYMSMDPWIEERISSKLRKPI